MLDLKTFVKNPNKYLKNKENIIEVYNIIYDLNVQQENKIPKERDSENFLNNLNSKYPLIKLNFKNNLIDNFYDISIGNKNLNKLLENILNLSNRYIELDSYIKIKTYDTIKTYETETIDKNIYDSLKTDIANFIKNFENKYDPNIFETEPKSVYKPSTPLKQDMLPVEYWKYFTDKDTKNLPENVDNSDNILDVFSFTQSKNLKIFEDKKVFYSVITDTINEIFKNNIHRAGVFSFIVNTIYKGIIDKLRLERKLVFIYKGGQAMMNIFRSIKDLLSDETKNDLDKYFSRSDADYQIYILERNENNYNKLHRQGLDIIYQCNNFIKNMIWKYNNIIFDLNKIENRLENIIETLNNSIEKKDDSFKFKNYRIVGVTFNDKTTFIEEIPSNFKFKRIDDNIIDPTDLMSKEKNFKKNKELENSYRNDFYITIDKDNTKFKKLSDNNNSLYSYINETTFFGNQSVTAIFSLGRIKLNTVLYLKDNNDNYSFLNCPGEILDVSLPKLFDSKSTDNIFEIKQEYNYSDKILGNVKYDSYNLDGFIKDFFPQFKERKFIWEIPKFEKKLQRLVFLFSIYLSKKNKDDFPRLKGQFIDNLKLIKNNNNYTKFTNEYKLLNDFLEILENNSKIANPEEKIKLDKIIDENIIQSLNKYNYVKYQYTGTFDLKYINKYLKYKSKYLNLKNKMT